MITVGGELHYLKINSSSTVAKLYHAVRKFIQSSGSFDLVHDKMEAVFGYVDDYGSREYAVIQQKKLCNLRIRNDSVVTVVEYANVLDDDGEEIPALVSSDSNAET